VSLERFPTGDRYDTLDRSLIPDLPHDLEYREEHHAPLAEWPNGPSVIGWGLVALLVLVTSFLWLNVVTLWVVIAFAALSMASYNRYMLPCFLFVIAAPWLHSFSLALCLVALPIVLIATIWLGDQIAHEYALFATANPRAIDRKRWRHEFEFTGSVPQVAAALAPLQLFTLLVPWVRDGPAWHLALALYLVAIILGGIAFCAVYQALAHPRSVPAFAAALQHYLVYGRPDAPPWAFRCRYGSKVVRRARFQLRLLAFWGVVMWAAGHFPWAVLLRVLSPEAQQKFQAGSELGSHWLWMLGLHDEGGMVQLLLSLASWLTLPPLAFVGLLYAVCASRVTRYYLAFEAPDATAIDRSITELAGYQDRMGQSAAAELRDTILIGERTWPTG
jgi:hypothetical protein